MYQKLLIAMMSLTIGFCGSSELYRSANLTQASWGLLYPRLCFIEGTYQKHDGEVKKEDQNKGLTEDLAESAPVIEPEQMIIRWKLLELLCE